MTWAIVFLCIAAGSLLAVAAFKIGQLRERNAMLERELQARRKIVDKRAEDREKLYALVRENTRVSPRPKP